MLNFEDDKKKRRIVILKNMLELNCLG